MTVQIRHKLDWLTLTKKLKESLVGVADAHERLLNVMRYEASYIGVDVSEYEIVRGDGFYDLHVYFPVSEVRVSGAYATDIQGLRCVFTGKSLPETSFGLRVLSSAIQDDWKPTRIDLAVDLFDSDVSVEQWYYELFKVHGANRQRSLEYKRKKRGDSVYLGSRESDKFLRIYDKAKEQGLDNDWVRVEVEAKGDIAQQLAGKILGNWSNAPMVHVLMLSLPHFWLAQYIESYAQGETVSFDPRYSTKDGRERWLYEVVGKTLAKMKAKTPDEYEAFSKWIDEMSQGYDTEQE